MDCPEGMLNSEDGETLLLNSTIYGLVQLARQYYKKAASIKAIRLKGSTIDQCLYVQRTKRELFTLPSVVTTLYLLVIKLQFKML